MLYALLVDHHHILIIKNTKQMQIFVLACVIFVEEVSDRFLLQITRGILKLRDLEVNSIIGLIIMYPTTVNNYLFRLKRKIIILSMLNTVRLKCYTPDA